jgi:hypothetical protein
MIKESVKITGKLQPPLSDHKTIEEVNQKCIADAG